MGTFHRVQPGECLIDICPQYGFGDWKTVYNDPGNAALRKLRPDPNMLVPGDKVFIPDQPRKVFRLATGKAHVLTVKTPQARLRLKVHEHVEGEIWSGAYELTIDGIVDPLSGTIGDDGLIDVEIPSSARQGRLNLKKDDKVLNTFVLQLGGLPPLDSIGGVQARLNRLGFACGAVDGVLGSRTKHALSVFRLRYALDADPDVGNEVGGATLDKLKELCDR